MKSFQNILKESEDKYIDIHSVDLQREYRKYAAELFGNDMPYVPIEIRPIKAGACVDGLIHRLTGHQKIKRMVMSSKYKFTPERLKNVLVHEMIHVWIMHNQIREVGGMHGLHFQKKIHEINSRGGFNIGLNDDGAESAVENKKGIYVLLAHQKGTQKFLMSVLADNQKDDLSAYLFDWYDYMDAANEQVWELYYLLSNDNQLMTYPKSRMAKTLKKYIIKPDYYKSLITHSKVIRHQA
jgi:hypothetical protein